MAGGQLASWDYVASDGQQSWSLGYRSAVTIKRFIATTLEFRTKNAKAFQMLQHAVAQGDSRWILSDGLKTYEKRRESARKNKKLAEVLMISVY